jgi:pimeloyl-ACP methyl ester carboxylesterase
VDSAASVSSRRSSPSGSARATATAPTIIAGTPLVLLQHFTGTLDDWDPALIDGLAKTHKLYILDNADLGASGGTTPDAVPAMAKVAESFIDALHMTKVDLLGFSLGGLVSQPAKSRRS